MKTRLFPTAIFIFVFLAFLAVMPVMARQLTGEPVPLGMNYLKKIVN